MSSSNTQSVIDNKKITILLIDDNPVNNKLVASILMPQGYNIYITDNGESGISLASRMMPDLILLDIMMPKINGFQVCKHLKNDSSTKEIPVIFITADSSTKTQTKSFQLGGSDFITKPIVDVVLMERIKHQIKLSQDKKRLKTLNNYHELSEHLSNTGFWACQDIRKNKELSFSNQLSKILELKQNTLASKNFNLDSITAIIATSSDSITRTVYKKNWLKSIEEGGMFDEICHCTLESGTKFIRIWAHFNRETSGKFSAFGAIQNITQVINTENELSGLKSKFEKLTTKQHMVEANTQLAHELNQPLAAINLNISYIRHLIDSTPDDSNKIYEAINDISSDVTRATNIVKNIRRILHKEPVLILKFDLNKLLDETIHVFNRDLLKKGITLIYDGKEEPCIIRSDKTGLQQVIVNLLKNSIEAIDNSDIESPVIEITTAIHEKTTNIFICDSGPGIAETERENIFRQYYTSKRENTGMGLAICKAIMEEIDGDIQLVSPPEGRSTCFKVTIND